jgi:hypothetical protein
LFVERGRGRGMLISFLIKVYGTTDQCLKYVIQSRCLPVMKLDGLLFNYVYVCSFLST